MTYLRRNLTPNEQLVAETELHWILFFAPTFYSALFILFLMYRPAAFPHLIDMGGLCFIAIVWLMAIVQYLTTEFAVSKKRLLTKRGFIQVQTNDMLVSRIESVHLQQSLLGSLLGYGTVMVHGTGGVTLVLAKINAPAPFRQKILEQSETTDA